MSLLDIPNVTKRIGGILAVNDVSFNLDEKAILGLIGPNGSGKTTLFSVMTGFYKPDSGMSISMDAALQRFNLTKLHRGLVAFQITRAFKLLTVLENLLAAWPQGIGKQAVEKAQGRLEFLNLERLKDEYAENISYGQQRLTMEEAVLRSDRALADKVFCSPLMERVHRISDMVIEHSKLRKLVGFTYLQ